MTLMAYQFGAQKKKSATCYFHIGTKKIIAEPSFFTNGTITGEKCTRAHVQENIYIYIYIYYLLVYIYLLKTESLDNAILAF